MIPVRRQPRRRCASLAAIILASGVTGSACVMPPTAEQVGEQVGEQAAEQVGEPWSVVQRLPAERIMLRGRIDAEHFALDPVVVATGPAEPDLAAPGFAGPYRLRGWDEAGGELFEHQFGEGALVASSPGAARHFMFIIEVPGGGAGLAKVELSAADGRRSRHEARLSSAEFAAALVQGEGLAVARLPTGAVRVRWNPARFVSLQFNHPQTGAALGVGRAGEITLTTDSGALDISVSDGVRSGATRFGAP